MRATKSKMLAVAAAAVLPLGLAGPAEAAAPKYVEFYADGCRVKLHEPYDVGDHEGWDRARIKVTWVCRGSDTIRLEQRGYEEDNGKPGDWGGNDLLFKKKWGPYKVRNGYVARDIIVKKWDRDYTNELFQQVRVTVCTGRTCDTNEWWKGNVVNWKV